MKIVGIRPSEFKGDDGSIVRGKNFYLSYPPDKGEGYGTERVYLTEVKQARLSFTPSVGDEVRVLYDRWGKCSGMELLDG